MPFLTEFQDATYLSMIAFLFKSFFYGIYCVKKYNINIVHSFYLFPSGLISLILGKIFKIKNSTTIVGGEVFDPTSKRQIYKNKIYMLLIKFVLKYSDFIASISSDVKSRANKFYFRSDIIVLPLGIHQKDISIENTNKDIIQLCSLSRLENRKGIDLTLRAISMLKNTNIEYHIMGDGKEKVKLKQLCHDLSIDKKVFFHGFVTDEGKDNIFSKSDIFILPSHHEGFGIVFLESMEYGLPVITTDCGGQTDFIFNEKNGFLLNDREPNHLAQIIDKLIEDKELYKSIKSTNLNDIKQYYWSFIKNKYIEFFNKH